MAENVNRVILTGNLTRDPEVKDLANTTVANMRVAVNSRVKREGEWQEKPNYVDVAVFGATAKACGQYLSKGSPIAVDGRLDWQEWTDKEDHKRQGLSVIADTIQFLRSKGDGDSPSTPGDGEEEPAPASVGGGGAAGGTEDLDDIPFIWDGPTSWDDRYHSNR